MRAEPFGTTHMRAIRLLSLFLAQSALAGNFYTTSFSGTENPLSEGGSWLNGHTDGSSWTDMRKTPGFAFGTESGASGTDDDSTAILNVGSWGSHQHGKAVVKINGTDSESNEEVEIRLRSTMTSGSSTGYEFLFSVLAGNPYCQIVKWNGAVNAFTLLNATGTGVANGDVIEADANGSTLTASINGSVVLTATDSTYSSGSPGIGNYIKGSAGNNSNFGISSFTAADGDPVITTQPVNQTANVGATATFTISAGGFTTLSYQWKFNGSNVGSNSSTYARTNCQLSDSGGSVTCVVTDTAGNVTSSTATLTVNGGVASSTFTIGGSVVVNGTLKQ